MAWNCEINVSCNLLPPTEIRFSALRSAMYPRQTLGRHNSHSAIKLIARIVRWFGLFVGTKWNATLPRRYRNSPRTGLIHVRAVAFALLLTPRKHHFSFSSNRINKLISCVLIYCNFHSCTAPIILIFKFSLLLMYIHNCLHGFLQYPLRNSVTGPVRVHMTINIPARLDFVQINGNYL